MERRPTRAAFLFQLELKLEDNSSQNSGILAVEAATAMHQHPIGLSYAENQMVSEVRIHFTTGQQHETVAGTNAKSGQGISKHDPRR